jgi:hypothetical protein
MSFGWINVFGAIIVVLMLVPNVVYALKNRGEENRCTNRWMNLLEQIGRYGCIAFMWFPLLVGKFSFRSVPEMTLYLGGNGALLAVYWFVYARYLRERTRRRALTLAVVPACIFLMSGLLLRHWLLVVFALFFAVGHIYVTTQNVA